MRYIIIGAGAAGISAAETIRQVDQFGEILIFTAEPFGYYSRPGLAYYLTGEIPESQLHPLPLQYFQDLNIKIRQAAVEKLDPKNHLIQLSTGNQIRFDRLLIATGSTAIQPDLPGVDLDGVVKLDNLYDARQILDHIRRGKSAVVVGGGITALEIVEGLQANKIKTHFLLRKTHYWSSVLDETESKIVLSRLKHEGVIIRFNSELAAIVGKNGKVSAAITKDNREIPCQIVAIAIGVKPNIDIARKGGLKVDRGILVNQYLETSAPDVYAAGDVTQIIDPTTGKGHLDILWGPARDEGRIAGMNMAGNIVEYFRTIPMNVTRLAGLTTTIIGNVNPGSDEDDDLVTISRGDSEIWREIPDAIIAQEDFDVNRIRLIVGEKTLLGAIVMGNQTLSSVIQRLVAEQVDITPIKTELLQKNADIACVISDFWQARRKMFVAPGL
jgi:NADPH-dependent 2,4-dienoyl-CoA reductase/sulfur reductase-like enzyme